MGKCFSVCFYQRFDGWLPQSHLQNLLGCAGHTQMAHAVSSLWDLIPQVLPLEGLCGVEHLKINLLIEKGRKLKRQYIFQLCCRMLTPAQSKWRLRMWFFNCSASFLGWLCVDSLYFALDGFAWIHCILLTWIQRKLPLEQVAMPSHQPSSGAWKFQKKIKSWIFACFNISGPKNQTILIWSWKVHKFEGGFDTCSF